MPPYRSPADIRIADLERALRAARERAELAEQAAAAARAAARRAWTIAAATVRAPRPRDTDQ